MVDHIAFRLKPRIREGLMASCLALFFFCSTMMYHESWYVCSPCLHAKTFLKLPGLSSQTSFSRTQRRPESHSVTSHNISHTFSILLTYCNFSILHQIHDKQISKFSFRLRRAKAKMMPNLSFLSRTLWKNLSNQFRAEEAARATMTLRIVKEMCHCVDENKCSTSRYSYGVQKALIFLSYVPSKQPL